MKLLLVLVILVCSSPNSQAVSPAAISTTLATTSVPCPASSVSFNNVCYRAIYTNATWINAAVDCASQGGNLTSISNAFVNNFIVNLAEQHFGTPTRFWIGGSNSISSNNGSWVWIDGNNMTYTNWAIGRPRNIAAYDSIQMHTPSGQWYDTPGVSAVPYVCEVPPAETNPCYGSNWYYLAETNKCYLVITQDGSFLDQQSTCYSLNGDLVSIHSSRENFFVGALAARVYKYDRYLIGLTYTPGNSWSWVDGTPLNWWPNNLTISSNNTKYYGLLDPTTTKNKFLWDELAYNLPFEYPAICESDPSFMKKEKKIVN
uniref:C-type lectin domain-containing protein n=1 Tax=Acrobeloides nanus TaxID=290746 RepID=A0A914DBP9_9BILA